MTLNRLVVPAIAIFLGVAGPGIAKASGLPQAQSASSYGQDRDAWDTPPQDLQEIQRLGFRDGIVGARKDFDNHRRPDVNDRDEYRNPHLPPEQREAYCDGFRRGYERGVSHFIGGPDQPVSPPEPQMREPARSGPDVGSGMSPGLGSEIQRRGFEDGMAGARKDLDNHRRPDVNDRAEYRHPNIPPELRQEYLAAFRRGYDHFMSEQAGGPPDPH